MKKVKELSAIRFQVVILGAAVLIAVGYLAYYLFKFYRLATSVINDYADEEPDEEPDEGTPDEEPRQEPTSPNGQAKNEPQTVT